VEAALIIEQLGTTLVPEPYIPSVVVAGTALLQAGSSAQHEEFLAPMIAGEKSLALATVEVQSRHDVSNVVTAAEKSGDGYKLSGQKRWVLNGHAADHILVSARTGGLERDRDGVSLFLLDPGMKGLTLEKVQTMDGHKAAMLDLDGVVVGKDRLVGEEGAASPVLEHVMDYGAAAVCAEGSGILQTVLAMTRNYLTERKQFGLQIGTFQALQHRAVDMFVETELAKGTAILAMLKVDDPDVVERKRAISSAKAHLAGGGIWVCRQAIQLHGGIGVTDEHDVGLYFKRLTILNRLFGDEQWHTNRFAALPTFTRHIDARA
jgi:alkylation response protein AidB-like acyl-CoA dehydrogenase